MEEVENFPFFSFGIFPFGIFLFSKVDIQVWSSVLPGFPVIPSLGTQVGSPGFPRSQFHASLWPQIFGIFGKGKQILGNKNCSIKIPPGSLPGGNSVGSAAMELHMDQLGADSHHPNNRIHSWECPSQESHSQEISHVGGPGSTPGWIHSHKTQQRQFGPSRIHIFRTIPGLPGKYPGIRHGERWGRNVRGRIIMTTFRRE